MRSFSQISVRSDAVPMRAAFFCPHWLQCGPCSAAAQLRQTAAAKWPAQGSTGSAVGFTEGTGRRALFRCTQNERISFALQALPFKG
jgi:hypothetical protein